MVLVRKYDFYTNVGLKFQSRFISCSENYTFQCRRVLGHISKKRLRMFFKSYNDGHTILGLFDTIPNFLSPQLK